MPNRINVAAIDSRESVFCAFACILLRGKPKSITLRVNVAMEEPIFCEIVFFAARPSEVNAIAALVIGQAKHMDRAG
jgi:hypothetical protein